jgi:hypothetical protein
VEFTDIMAGFISVSTASLQRIVSQLVKEGLLAPVAPDAEAYLVKQKEKSITLGAANATGANRCSARLLTNKLNSLSVAHSKG